MFERYIQVEDRTKNLMFSMDVKGGSIIHSVETSLLIYIYTGKLLTLIEVGIF